MDASDIPALPFVDEHSTVVAAGADAVWQELEKVLERSFSSGRTAVVARLLGCDDPRGFRVAKADPGRELALVGRHRFSSYALIFRLDESGPGRIRVRAETRARFPGPVGALYRKLVIGSGGHAMAVRHMLTTVRRRAPKGRGAV